jgi:transposase-like protein
VAQSRRRVTSKNRNGIAQRYVYTKCGKYSSDSQPVEGLRLEHGKVVQTVNLLAEGLGVRGRARATDCDPHSVLNVLETIGPKCEALHNRRVRNISTGAVQVDELSSRVGIRQSRTTPADTERGDFYTFLRIATREKLIIGYCTGKRDGETTDVFVKDLASRINGRIQITSDGF